MCIRDRLPAGLRYCRALRPECAATLPPCQQHSAHRSEPGIIPRKNRLGDRPGRRSPARLDANPFDIQIKWDQSGFFQFPFSDSLVHCDDYTVTQFHPSGDQFGIDSIPPGLTDTGVIDYFYQQ